MIAKQVWKVWEWGLARTASISRIAIWAEPQFLAKLSACVKEQERELASVQAS